MDVLVGDPLPLEGLAQASDGFDAAQVAELDQVQVAIIAASIRRDAHAAAKIGCVGDHDALEGALEGKAFVDREGGRGIAVGDQGAHGLP